MKKRIISLGLLATVLSFTSCVKDNESDSVVAQRQAQTEKLKAEAKEALSNAGLADAKAKVEESMVKLREQEIALKELEVAKQKALDAYQLELAKENNKANLLAAEAELNRAEGALELAKAKLESDKQTAWKNLEDLKLQIIKDKDEVAQAIENYKGTKEKEALNNVENKYNWYSYYMQQLGSRQASLISAKQDVISAENNLVDIKVAKERRIAEENRKIVSYKKRIEFLKQYAKYSNDIDGLNAKLAEAKEKYEKAKDYVTNVAEVTRTKAENELEALDSKWYDSSTGTNTRYSNFEFYKAKVTAYYSTYFGSYVHFSDFVNSPERKYQNETVEKDGFTTTKVVYDTNYLPSFKNERFDLKIDEFDQAIKSETEDLNNNLIPDRNTKKTDMENKKTAYEQDKSDNTKKTDYEQALFDYEQAEEKVEDKRETIQKLKDIKQGLLDTRAKFLNADNQKAVKDYFAKLNEAETAKANAELELKIATKKKDDLENEYNDLYSIKTDAEAVDTSIKNLEDEIKDSERNIANLSGVQNKEQLVANAKARVASLEQQIELLKKNVEAAKKAYEDALAAL